jgi:predicted N-formylglutamate amidohydrolase
MVDHGWAAALSEHEAWRLIGEPRFGGILVVSDHASNRVPADIALGIDPDLLNQHIAVDIGVGKVGLLMASRPGIAAFQANASRLVCDVNREPLAPAVIPIASDGHAVPGNALDHAAHLARLERFHTPYHAALAATLEAAPPALVLSLHSFTPQLATSGEPRPWQLGVLYNADDRAARIAIPLLEAEGLMVGDQQPYSGKLLNYTMNRHCEADWRPYLGIELRQDQIGDPRGQTEWAARLADLCNRVALSLG